MKSILLVDDISDIRDHVEEILSLAQYNVLTACNGKEGIEKAYEYMPDLIISDIRLPVIDGLGMLRILRKNALTESVPFIFLASKNDHSDYRNAMDSGADDYIIKPFNGDELLKAIETRFKRAAVIKKNLKTGIGDLNPITDLPVSNSGSLETLLQGKDINIYQKKQLIYKEGHTPHYLYYIQKGKVRDYKTHDDGKQLVTGLYNEGDFIGYIPLLQESAYQETAEAIEETELIQIPKRNFSELLHRNHAVQERVIKMLAKNISDNEKHLLGIAYDTLRKKVASTLINLHTKYHNNKEEAFIIDICRSDLAAIAGTATESLIRTLTEFKNEKLILINSKDNKIEIINFDKLEKLVR